MSSALQWMAVSLSVLIVALIGGAAWRLLRGPQLADRFVALDMLTGLAIALLAVVSVVLMRRDLLDVGMGVAAFSFIGTVAAATFLARYRAPKR